METTINSLPNELIFNIKNISDMIDDIYGSD